MVPGDHPFIDPAALETEGVTLLRRLITDLYTKQCVGKTGSTYGRTPNLCLEIQILSPLS